MNHFNFLTNITELGSNFSIIVLTECNFRENIFDSNLPSFQIVNTFIKYSGERNT